MLPPFSSASAPAREASGCPETTTARSETTSGLISGCSATIASMAVSSAASSCAAWRLRAVLVLELAAIAPLTALSSSRAAAASPTRDRKRRRSWLALGGRLSRSRARRSRPAAARRRATGGRHRLRQRAAAARRVVALGIAVVGRIGRRQVRRSRAACRRATMPGAAAVTRHEHGRLDRARPRRRTGVGLSRRRGEQRHKCIGDADHPDAAGGLSHGEEREPRTVR